MRYQKRCSSDPEPVGMALMMVGGIICFTIGAACSSIIFALTISISLLAHHT